MELIKQNSKLSAMRLLPALLPRLPESPARTGTAFGALRLFALVFACYLGAAFLIMQHGYLDAWWVAHQARGSEFGMLAGVTGHNLQSNLGTSMLWLLSLASGIPASVLLYVLPAAAGAFLAAWAYAGLSAHWALPMRALCCFLVFASPGALAQFAMGSALALKVLVMTAAVSAVTALFNDRQPRRYLAFGALLAILIVIEPHAHIALMLLLPPYIVCGIAGRSRTEWITHAGLALFPLLATWAAVAYFDWILRQYVPSMWFGAASVHARAGREALPGMSAMSLAVPLLLSAWWIMRRDSGQRKERIWGIVCGAYLVSFVLVSLSPEHGFRSSELQAYGLGISIAALARAPVRGARRQLMLCLCLCIAQACDWGWNQGGQMSENGRWRHALESSFSSAVDMAADMLPDLVSRSFAGTTADRDYDSADMPAPPGPAYSMPAGENRIQEYFARYGVQFNQPASAPATAEMP
jgi:hypothetical protein